MIEEIAALNASTERLKTIELWQPVPVRYRTRGKNDSCLCWVLQGVIKKDEKYMFCDCLNDCSSLSFFSNRYIFSFSILYIITSRASIRLSLRMRQLKCCNMSPASIRLSLRLCQFKCCNMSPALDVFRCLLVANLSALHWTNSSW